MLAAAVLRAMETGRPVLRATTTGITAAIDGDGRVSGRLPRGRPGTLRIESRLSDAPITTFYSRIGDGPVIMVAILLTLWGRPTKSESA
jgi:apolipoprotein N-acyltransferase